MMVATDEPVSSQALGDRDEKSMTEQEIAQAMIAFYQGIVRRRGGRRFHPYVPDYD